MLGAVIARALLLSRAGVRRLPSVSPSTQFPWLPSSVSSLSSRDEVSCRGHGRFCSFSSPSVASPSWPPTAKKKKKAAAAPSPPPPKKESKKLVDVTLPAAMRILGQKGPWNDEKEKALKPLAPLVSRHLVRHVVKNMRSLPAETAVGFFRWAGNLYYDNTTATQTNPNGDPDQMLIGNPGGNLIGNPNGNANISDGQAEVGKMEVKMEAQGNPNGNFSGNPCRNPNNRNDRAEVGEAEVKMEVQMDSDVQGNPNRDPTGDPNGNPDNGSCAKAETEMEVGVQGNTNGNSDRNPNNSEVEADVEIRMEVCSMRTTRRLYKANTHDYNSIIFRLYRRCKGEGDAAWRLVWLLVDDMEKRGCAMDDVTVGHVIRMCFLAGKTDKASEFYATVRQRGFVPGPTVYNVLVSSLAEGKNAKTACRLYKQVIRHGIPVADFTFQRLFRALYDMGKMEVAMGLFRTRKECGETIHETLYPWAIASTLRLGRQQEALELWNELESREKAPLRNLRSCVLTQLHKADINVNSSYLKFMKDIDKDGLAIPPSSTRRRLPIQTSKTKTKPVALLPV